MRHGVERPPIFGSIHLSQEITVDPRADFERFVTVIRRCGSADFYRIRHIYWTVHELKYWTTGSVGETTVINRARVDAPEPWKARAKGAESLDRYNHRPYD